MCDLCGSYITPPILLVFCTLTGMYHSQWKLGSAGKIFLVALVVLVFVGLNYLYHLIFRDLFLDTVYWVPKSMSEVAVKLHWDSKPELNPVLRSVVCGKCYYNFDV